MQSGKAFIVVVSILLLSVLYQPVFALTFDYLTTAEAWRRSGGMTILAQSRLMTMTPKKLITLDLMLRPIMMKSSLWVMLGYPL